MKLFVVLTRGRTGSTPIVDDLDQHPKIICHQEMFRREPVVAFRDRAPSYEAAVAKAGKPLSIDKYLSQTAAVAAPDVEYVGFKLLLNQMDERKSIGMRQFVLNDRLPVIFLTRNPIRAALSGAIARARGAFNWRTGPDDERYKHPVSVDPKYVLDSARYYAHFQKEWTGLLSSRNVTHAVYAYEDYVADRLGTINDMFRFLGAPELAALKKNPYSKVTSEDVWDDVTNSVEVKAALTKHGFQL